MIRGAGSRDDLRIQSVCIDSTEPVRLADFWQAALEWRRTHEDPDEIVLEPPAGSAEDGVVPDLLILRVPEDKAGKNRRSGDLNLCGRRPYLSPAAPPDRRWPG